MTDPALEIPEHVYDPEAERAVLAACMNDQHSRDEARKVITREDLYQPAHQRIWDAIGTLERTGKAVAPVTVLAALGDPAQLPVRAAVDLMPDLLGMFVPAVAVASHAEIVRAWAIRRRLNQAAIQVAQRALSANINPTSYAAEVATKFAAIRDSGLPDTTTARTLGEILAEPDDEPDWLIPHLLERRDRLMLTGVEGGGKSHLLRQIAICAAAGLDPFDARRIKPIKATIIDAENTEKQIKRRARGIADWCAAQGQPPFERVVIDCKNRMDITGDRSLAEIHQLLDATQPDIVVIGPLYRLIPRALQSDDEATPLLAALDTIRDRGIALLIEAHAGHATGEGGRRQMRPRGSSALLGWPEFGYGLVPESQGVANLMPWRGDRDQRAWPDTVKRDYRSPRWVPVDANWRDLAGVTA